MSTGTSGLFAYNLVRTPPLGSLGAPGVCITCANYWG